MKKNLTIILSIVLLAFLGFAFTDSESTETGETTGITFFDGTWEEALIKAKKENKLIFVDAYAAWCGPCKILSKRYFTKENVGEYYNTNFINYKMDMEKHENGPRLAKKWGLRAYPTLYFINSDEQITHASVGLIDDTALLKIGAEAKAKKLL